MAKTFRYIKQEVDVHTVVIDVPVRYGDEDIPFDAPGRTGDAWRAVVLVDSGQIVDWPGGALDLFMKVCNEGVYTLHDADGNELGKVDYVPNGVVPGEHGDYVELDIDETGRIRNWPKASEMEFDAFGLGELDECPRRSVYVAAALPQKAHASRFARQLEAAGVLVTSTWHETDATPQIEAAMPDEQRAEVAERCLQEVDAADTFVWLHGGACGRIGAIVEYGYALGRGKDVYLVPLDGLEIGSVFGAISPVAAPGDVVRALAEVAP